MRTQLVDAAIVLPAPAEIDTGAGVGVHADGNIRPAAPTHTHTLDSRVLCAACSVVNIPAEFSPSDEACGLAHMRAGTVMGRALPSRSGSLVWTRMYSLSCTAIGRGTVPGCDQGPGS